MKDIILDGIIPPTGPETQYNFVKNNKDNLLITFGDSWTVGGSFQYLIHTDATDFNDPTLRQFQLDNIYGNTLRQHLDADWYNIAISGASNRWIVDKFQEFSKIRTQLNYKKIYVVITLTEVGREWEGMESPIFTSVSSLDDLIFKTSALIEDTIISCMPDNIELIIGRNYVDDSYPNLTKFMLPNNWLDVLIKPDSVTDNCYMLGFIAFNSLKKISSKLTVPRENLLREMTNYIDLAKPRLDRLQKSKFNIHKVGYQHPTPEGHKMWADYIIQARQLMKEYAKELI